MKGPASSWIPKSLEQNGVSVAVKKLNLSQIVDIGQKLQRINTTAKMVGIQVVAQAADPHYFDVVYKLVAFNLPPDKSGERFQRRQEEKVWEQLMGKILAPIISVFKFHKLKVLFVLFVAVILVIWNFPPGDLSDLVSDKASRATGIYMQFDSLGVALNPSPGIHADKLVIEPPDVPAIKAEGRRCFHFGVEARSWDKLRLPLVLAVFSKAM